MGSYNPASKVDQAQAAKVRELWSQGKRTPQQIYSSPEYKIDRESFGARKGSNISGYGGPASSANPTPPPINKLGPKPAQAPKVKTSMLHDFHEKAYLSYLNKELHKMAKESHSLYSKEYIDQVTSSAEAFNKAAQEEAKIVWEGIKDQLKKEGADEDFILGMEKEAGAYGMSQLLFSPKTILRNPIKTLRAVVPAAFSGKAPTEQMLAKVDSGYRGLGGLKKTDGTVLRDPTSTPNKFRGARTNEAADRLEQLLGPKITREQKDLIDKVRGNALTEFQQQLDQVGTNAIAKDFSDLELRARQPGKTGRQARKEINNIARGDFSQLGKRLNIDQSVMNDWAAGKVGPGIPDLGAMGKLQGWAQEFKAKGPGGVRPLGEVLPGEVSKGRPSSEDWFRFTPREAPGGALSWGLGGTMLGGMFGMPFIGAGLGAGIGALGKTFGPGGALLAAGGAAIPIGMAGKSLIFGSNSDRDKYGLPTHRNQALPLVSNSFAGGVGGALLGALIARELGLGGIGGLVLPLLGGLAGHQYFPYMMNKWKDPYGVGENSVSPITAHFNRQ
jgi:hypothetical protein